MKVKCEKCGKRFKRENILYIRKPLTSIGGYYICKVCGEEKVKELMNNE